MILSRLLAWPPDGRDGAPLQVTIAAGLILATVAPLQAKGQLAQAWLADIPIEAGARYTSPRLEAMGDIQVAIEDDPNRINAYDYGHNPGALFAARDSSIVHHYSVYEGYQDRYHGLNHSGILRRSGVRGEMRREGKWVLAFDAIYSAVNASRHDLSPTPDLDRFLRDFNLPISSSMIPLSLDRPFGAHVRAPHVTIAYGRRIWRGITLGARFGYRNESEDRRLADPYDLDHTARSQELSGGLCYEPPVFRRMVSIGGYVSRTGTLVKGHSESSLNDDVYDWERPEIAYGGQIDVRGSRVRGVVDVRHRSFDGEQVAQINWAPEFFLNPFPSESDEDKVFRFKWTSFLSGLRHNEASTRWIVDLPGTPAHFGFRYGYYREFEWIRPIEAVLPTVRALDAKRVGYDAAGGLSLDLPDGAGAFATEVRLNRGHRYDLAGLYPDIASETLTYHAGGEYRARPRVPVRAGVVLTRREPDRRDGVAPYKGVKLSAGAGYEWIASGTRIDLALSHEHFHFSPGDPALELGTDDRATLAIEHRF